MTNLKTEIQEVMQLHCKIRQIEKQIKDSLTENLTSQKHYQPTVRIFKRTNVNDTWTMVIYIQYTSLNVYDIETVYSIVTRIKELFSDVSYTLECSKSQDAELNFIVSVEEGFLDDKLH